MKTITVTLLVLLLTGVCWAEDEKEQPDYDLTGSWKVLLSNSFSRKQVTFVFNEHKDGRVRGYLAAKGAQELKLDGKLKKGNKLYVWGRHVERTGQSFEYEFKGRVEGEPGNEKLVGKADFFDRRYDFVGERGTKKKTKR